MALLAVLYDAWGKHQNVFGPINMGLCRAGNLLLGMSLMDGAVQNYWYIGLIPLLYVAAITMVSRGEVHGQNILALKSGLVIYAVIVGFIFLLAYSNIENWWESLPFLALLSYFIFPPLVKALKYKEPSLIGKSVKAAVLALIIVNAAIAVAFAGWIVGDFTFITFIFAIGKRVCSNLVNQMGLNLLIYKEQEVLRDNHIKNEKSGTSIYRTSF